MCVNGRRIGVWAAVVLAGWCVPLRADASGPRESGCGQSGNFTIDNRGGGNLAVSQKAVGIFLAGVPFNNTFKAVVNDWGGATPGTVTFSLNGQTVVLPYTVGQGAETSEFDMGDLPGGDCAVTSMLSVTAKDVLGNTVAQMGKQLKCINRPFFMPPNMVVAPLAPWEWGQAIVYQLYPQLSFMNLDAVWEGENDLFKNFGGVVSGGALTMEFDGDAGEFTFGVSADLNITQDRPTLDSLFEEPTNKKWMGWKEGTEGGKSLSAGLSATAKISEATGCFDGGLEICGSGEFGYTYTIIPIGPIFPPLPVFFTGSVGFAISPELCFDPWSLDLECWYIAHLAPFTGIDVSLEVSGQGGLELGVPGILSVFGGLEGAVGGLIHVCGDPIETCWGLPYLADLTFDVSIVGYARAVFWEWELGRWVIVDWSCLDKRGVLLIPLDGPVVMRKAGRPYLENGEPYARFEPGVRSGAGVKRDGARGETDELVTENTNLEATPATAGNGNLTLVATSEDDPTTPDYVEHEVYAAFRDGAVWGEKVAVTDNTDADFQPAAAFDATGKPIVAWTTVAGTTGQETLEEAKAKMEMAWSVYDDGTDTWSVPTQLTSDTSLDAMPQLVRGADGSTNLIWLHSADNSLPIGPDDPPGTTPAVMAARWNGTVFGTPEVLLPACDAVGAIRYARDATGREYVLWTWDADDDPATIDDHEVYESHTVGGVWTTPAALTSNASAETAVGLLATSGGVVAYYVRVGGAEEQPQDLLVGRKFDGSQWSAEEVLISAMTAILSPSFNLAPDGSVSCAWVGPSFEEYGKGILYASSPDGWSNWSDAQQMAVSSLPTAPACTHAAGNVQVCYVSARPARGSEKIEFGLKGARSTAFDVRLLDHTPYTDLWVEAAGIVVSPQPPAGGEPATISVTVHLSGDFDQAGVEVDVFDGDPSQGGTLLGSDVADLIPGGKAVLEFPWTYPSDCAQHEIHVTVDPDDLVEELNEANNAVNVAIGGLNLLAVSLHPVFWTAEAIGVRVTVENASYATLSDVAFELRRDSETGPLILSDTLPSMPAGEQVQMVVPWDITLTDAGVYELFLIADPSGVITETEQADNVISGAIRVLPDLQGEQWSAAIVGTTAQVTVRNVGAKPMAATTVRVVRADQTLGEAPLSALGAGASADVTITLSESVHSGTVALTANPDSTGADEVSLLNNTAVVIADLDDDGDLDIEDFKMLAGCLAGPDVTTPPPGCDPADFAQADLDGEGDVDMADFAAFLAAFTGG